MKLKNLFARISFASAAAAASVTTALAAGDTGSANAQQQLETGLDKAASPVVDLLNSLMTPLLAIVGALGALYCVLLGVKYAKAEEPQDREKAKGHLKSAIIGFVLIFVLLLLLKLQLLLLKHHGERPVFPDRRNPSRVLCLQEVFPNRHPSLSAQSQDI